MAIGGVRFSTNKGSKSAVYGVQTTASHLLTFPQGDKEIYRLLGFKGCYNTWKGLTGFGLILGKTIFSSDGEIMQMELQWSSYDENYSWN
jgi:hypothetical protein